MANVYTMTVLLTTESSFDKKDIPSLMKEQWDQTAAAAEGDYIEVLDVQDPVPSS